MRYALDEVQEKVRKQPNRVHVVRSTGIDMIIAVRGCTAGEAVAFAHRAVLELTPDDYSATVRLRSGTEADVYGKVLEQFPWYLKFFVDAHDEELVIVSCHLTDRDIRTRAGVVRCTTRPGR